MATAPSRQERIWYKDPRGFMRDDRIASFVPSPAFTPVEQLNAVMRFAIYYALFAFVFKRSYTVFYVPLVTAAVTFMLHAADTSGARSARERMNALDVERDPVSRKLCTRPTRDNPFMNVLVSDYSRFPERPSACDISRADVSDRAERNFSHNLYRDSDDVFDRRTSSRPFYTTASTTIPNDQDGFARWLYGTGPTCKEGMGDACAARLHRHRPGA